MQSQRIRHSENDKIAVLQAMQAAAQQASVALQNPGHNQRPEKIAAVRDRFSDRLKEIGSPEDLVQSGVLGEAASKLSSTEKRAIKALFAVDNFERTTPVGHAVPNVAYSNAVLSVLGGADGRVSAGASLSGAGVQQQVHEQYDRNAASSAPAQPEAPAVSDVDAAKLDAAKTKRGFSRANLEMQELFEKAEQPGGILARLGQGGALTADENAKLEAFRKQALNLLAQMPAAELNNAERQALSEAILTIGAAGRPTMGLTPGVGRDHAGPQVNEPPKARTGLGHVDDLLNSLPDGTREAGRAFYKSKQDYNQYMQKTGEQIEGLLNSGMPIEQVLMLVMMILANRAEKKLGLKIKEVGFNEQLSLASGRGGDRAMMIGRLQSMGISETDAQALRRGDVSDAMAKQLTEKYGLNDTEVALLRDKHYDKKFDQAMQAFEQEVGSSTDIKAQQLSIASQEYSTIMSTMSSIIKTVQELIEMPTRKI